MPSSATTPVLPDLVYGDWEWDDTNDKPGALYPAIVYGGWSGGVCFLTDRATAEKIVEAQQALAEFAPPHLEMDRLDWDGDIVVRRGDPALTPERIEPNEDGLYDLSLGWTWSEWTEENAA